MPTTRKGGRPNQRARVQSQSRQIGQLETTPTSRHLQSRRVDDKPDPPSAQQPPQALANEFEDGIDDDELRGLDADGQDVAQGIWSEVASTRRSTPVLEAGRAPFDSPSSAIDDFSSLKSGSGKLPSTQPLPSQLAAGPEANNYDFSETATTARRSSPVQPHITLSDFALDRDWEYPENNTVPELPSTIPESHQVPEIDPMKHLPENELYDATPAPEQGVQDAPEQPQITVKSKPPQKAGAKRKATKGPKKAKAAIEILEKELGPADEESSVSPPKQPKPKLQKLGKNSEQVQESPGVQVASTTGTPKPAEAKGSGMKRGKQKFKPPLEVDATTQQVIEPQRKTANQSGHMSMVESMRQAHAASVSPIESTKKPTPKPRKKPSPKNAKKTAPKAALKVTAKPSPKTTSNATTNSATKTAPKPSPTVPNTTPKPARKAAAVAARRITRQSALAEQLTQPSSEEANIISPAVERDPITEASGAATKKITTTKTIVKTEPSLQHAKAQEEPQAINDTQGSTENPIPLSSAASSSSLSGIDNNVPPNDQAEVSPLDPAPTHKPEMLADPIVDPEELVDIAQDDQQQIVAPEPQVPKPTQPVRRPERRATGKEKSITVRADPKEPLLQRTNRPPIRIGPGEVLSARDANMLAQYNASKANILKRTTTTRGTLVDTSAPPRKVMKRSRSFSISRAGSPLPVDATGYPVEETSPIYEEEDEPLSVTNKQTNGLQQDYLSGLVAARTRVSVNERPRERETAPKDGRSSELSASDRDLHAQILASLQIPDEKLPEVQDGNENGKGRDEEEVAEPTLPKGPSEEVAEELHGLVKTMLRQLQTKEEFIYRAADTYQKNSIDCVEKIERKYEQEKQLLSKTWKKDSDRFIHDSRSLAPEKPYLSYYDVLLTAEDIKALKHDWLTDNNIAFWEEYLEREILPRYPQARIVLLRPSMTFLLMKEPDTRSIQSALPDFSKVTHVFLPINDNRNVSVAEGGSHWSLLLVSTLDGVAFHYDSLGGANYSEANVATRKLANILGRPLRFINLEDCPQQENGSDCGVFVCLLMRHLLVKRLLCANAREKVSMSMGGKMVDSYGGRKEMMRIIENFRKEGERRRS
ncbi:hypothetical protein NW768_002168 [Fusarium equiseti]|uniref:Ubiquitin-like protease family profile domain-containing protein n=1 Tax=Fusarium equiseti TaxID=61235 RepID=A0ABQ8RMU8_FUSEQ|nr:hypothetical protein NW768_002168 [Fusarium equiseti]